MAIVCGAAIILSVFPSNLLTCGFAGKRSGEEGQGDHRSAHERGLLARVDQWKRRQSGGLYVMHSYFKLGTLEMRWRSLLRPPWQTRCSEMTLLKQETLGALNWSYCGTFSLEFETSDNPFRHSRPIYSKACSTSQPTRTSKWAPRYYYCSIHYVIWKLYIGDAALEVCIVSGLNCSIPWDEVFLLHCNPYYILRCLLLLWIGFDGFTHPPPPPVPVFVVGWRGVGRVFLVPQDGNSGSRMTGGLLLRRAFTPSLSIDWADIRLQWRSDGHFSCLPPGRYCCCELTETNEWVT